MELTITGEFARQLFAKSKKDDTLARAMAKELLGAIEPAFMAEFLLKPEIAVALLAAKLQKDPEGTIKQLQRLPATQSVERRGRPRGRPAGTKGPTAARRAGGTQRRRRLTEEQVESLKQQVKVYLAKHPWSTRKDLKSKIDLPTQAIYRRIMVELQDTGVVIARGQKAKAVYALRGTKEGAGAKAKATKKRGRSKKAKSPKKTKTKAIKRNSRAKRGTKKTAKKAPRKKRAPVLCPVPGCKNKGAPIFGMLCKEHSKIPKEERAKLFAARRKK